MAIIDEYIGRIDRCLSTQGSEDKGGLVEEIVAAFIGPDPDIKKGLDRYKARATAPGAIPSYDDAGDLRKLKGKLAVLREKQTSEAASDPARLALGTIDERLAECRKLAASGDEESSRAFVDDMVCVYQGDIENIAIGISGYDYTSETHPVEDDLKRIEGHLLHYRTKLAADLAKTPASSLNVQASSMSLSSVENAVTLSQTAKAIQSIPSSALSDELKNELKALLFDLESSKGSSKKEAEGKLGKILSWLSDKGVDVAIATLPYIAGVLQTLS